MRALRNKLLEERCRDLTEGGVETRLREAAMRGPVLSKKEDRDVYGGNGRMLATAAQV